MTVADATGTASDRRGVPASVYLYGVCRRRDAAPSITEGVGGTAVEQVVHRDLAAIVSPIAERHVRAARRELVRHSDVLAAVLEDGQVLPMRFGTVYPSRDAVVAELLEPRHDELLDLLASLETKVELSVKAFYDEQAVLAEVVASTPRIARLREATRSRPDAATHALRIELGQAVARALDERRAIDADAILRRVQPFADRVFVDDQQVENLVLKAALLVDRTRVDAVDAAMDELAREQSGRIRFQYVGPLPPHSFVAIELPEQA